MTYSGNSAILGTGTVSADVIDAWYAHKGPSYASYAPDGTYRPAPAIGAAIVAQASTWGVNSDLAAAQMMLESAAWQSAISRLKNNPSGYGAENDDPFGKATTFATPAEGIRATIAHLCSYTRGHGAWDAFDPRQTNIAAIDALGVCHVLNDLNGRWAVPGRTYGQGIADLANELVAFAQSTGGAVSVPKPAMVAVSGVTNMDGYAGTRRAEAIVNHITDDRNVQGTLSWFKNPASKASSNYLIDLDGTLYEVVPPAHAAWTNGAVNKPDTTHPLIAKWLAEGVNFNMRTISKEFVGKGGDTYTDAQINTSNHLDAWLGQEFSIPLDRVHMLGHYQIDSVNRPYCPGQADAVWQRLVDGARALAVGGVVIPPDPNGARWFPETGHSIGGGFKAFWDANGGLPIFGFPLTEERTEDGLTVQYFERAVMEYHPLNTAPNDIQLRRLGAEALERQAA